MESSADAHPRHHIPSIQPAAEELLATLPWGLLIVDEHRIIQRINEQAARWCGARPEALRGQTLVEAELPAALRATLLSLLEPGETGTQEVFLPTQEQWVAFSSASQPHGWALYGQDITPQKQRAHAEEALAASEEKYRVLFDSIDEGFAILEILFDDAGEATDYRIVELNQAYEHITGLPRTVVGRRLRELMPNVEQDLLRHYGEVVRTGEPLRYEQHVAGLGRWFDVFSARVGGVGGRTVASVFNDITKRKQQEQQQAFLLRFSDALRAETSATSVAYRALGMLAEQLQLDRCYIGLYDLAEDRGIFPHQVGNHRIPPLPAEVRLSDFLAALRVAYDRTLRIDDLAQTEGLSDTDRQNLGALGLRALVAATLRRVGAGPQWAIVALSADVRHWTPGEVALLEEATERTWAAMEYARAEAALRASQATLATVFEALPMGVGVLDAHGRFILANRQMQHYLPTGIMPSQDATQYARWRAYHPDGQLLPRTEYPGARALRGEKVLPGLEMLYTPEDGPEVWTQVSAVPLPDRTGHVTVILDVDVVKRAEEALRHAEERHRAELEQQVAARTQELQESRHLLQTVFDASPTAIVVMRILRDAAGRAEDFEILLYNKFNQQIVGRDDLAGQRFSAMFPHTVPTGILARLLTVATTGEPADFEQWYAGEGIEHWFRHLFVRQDGLLVMTSEVITARKQAEQERLRTLRLLEQAEAVAGMGSWDYDLRSGEFLWSEGMYHLFCLPRGQPVSPDVYLQFVLEEDRPRAEQLIQCLTTGNGDFEDTLRLQVGEQVKTVRLKTVVFTDKTGQPVRVLGVDLDISELQRLEADNLRLRLTQQQALFEAVQAAQEQERRRMAESLHNGIGQILFATKLRLDQLHVPLLHTAPALVAVRHEADHLLAEAIRQTRALSHELVPLTLEKFGLAVALQDMGRDMNTPQLRFTCQVLLDEDAPALSSALQLALYRMAQELALNIGKHAHGATEASLELETMPGWVLLRAEDNGPGFAANPATEGLGLRSMRDRVALLGGQLKTGAIPTSGAYVRIRIPYPTA